MLSFLRTALPNELVIDEMKVLLKIHPRARNLTLRYDGKKSCFILTAPKRASKKSMHEFAQQNTGWMRKQITVTPENIRLGIGDILPLQGKDRLIIHVDAPGVKINLTDETITVHCRLARFPRALQRFLQQHAYDVIASLCFEKAVHIEKTITAITMRDTTSRWGSCSHDGKLSFSWRLIMAPQEVIDYVVGHEVAHLKVFNHSARFWETCRKLTDHTTFGKHWLQQNGSGLHRIQIVMLRN